jgi:Reverse transcriptase (RNA-dependent DNA polymerase)
MPPIIGGYKYVQSFIDGRARLKYIYLLKNSPILSVRCVILSSSSSSSTTASSSPCMLTTRQSLLVVISTAASASSASSLPALRRFYRNPSDSQKTSIRFCLLAFVAFSIPPAWIWLCGEKLPTTPYTYSTSRRQDPLATSLRKKLRMALCLMSASFACLAVWPFQRSYIPRSSTTRQCALPAWVTLVTESIVCCGMNILRSHLVLKAKRDTAGAIIKYKARLVAGGDAQVHDLDFDQSYPLVAYFTVVRVILSIAARENRVVHSLDVSNAFVRAPLAQVVYVCPPKILADRFGSKIMKLKKALYGLKQAPLSWHLHLEKMFDTVNIIKITTPCLYAFNNCTIVVYVDDLIISGPNVEEVTVLKDIIKGLFGCPDDGAMKEYLGVLFERRDDGAFVLSQRQYLLNVLQRFGMEDCKRCATPCAQEND